VNHHTTAIQLKGIAMNALLVYPEFPNTFWSYKHALKFIRKKAAFPPLGLLTIGSMLPEEWSLRLVDLNVCHLTAKDLSWADCALGSATKIRKSRHRRAKNRRY
jgi:hypothetical protein